MSVHECSSPNRILILAGLNSSLINFRGSLIKAFCDAGVEVHAAAPDLTSNLAVVQQLGEWGVICHDIPLRRVGINPIADMKGVVSLYRLMRATKPDAVFGYTIKPVLYGTLAAWLSRVPKRYALITGLGYAFSGEARGKRALILGVVRRLYRMSLRYSHHVFFQNPDDQTLFQQLNLLPVSVPSTVVNGSGVNISHFKYEPLPDAPPAFLLIARLIADKGIRLYAEAAKQLKFKYPYSKFYLVGDLDSNPESIKREELDDWVASGAIDYLGQLSDVRPAIAKCHVFVLPTYYREGVPRTILEAMAMGRAVITTDAPGCRETVVEGENGYLIPVKNVDALSRSMEIFIKAPERLPAMAARARAIAEEKYDVHKVNAVMLEVMGLHV